METPREITEGEKEAARRCLSQMVQAGCAWCEKPLNEEELSGKKGGAFSVDDSGWRFYCSLDCIIRAEGAK